MTRDEIREVFMQVAIYCGVPAGVDSFRVGARGVRGNGQEIEMHRTLFALAVATAVVVAPLAGQTGRSVRPQPGRP